MVNTLNVGDVVECVVRKVQSNGLSVSLPNGKFGYVPKYCAQTLCDADGYFAVRIGDEVRLVVRELGQPVQLAEAEDGGSRVAESRPRVVEREPVRVSAQSGPKVLGKIDLSRMPERRRGVEAQRRDASGGQRGRVPEYRLGEALEGVVTKVQDNGVYVQLSRGGAGFLPTYLMDKDANDMPRRYRRGERVVVGVSANKDYLRLCGEEKLHKQEQREMMKPVSLTSMRFVSMTAFLAEHGEGEIFLMQVAGVEDDRAVLQQVKDKVKIEGVVWRNEVSWHRTDSVRDSLREGDTVDAMFIGADRRHNRLMFSIKQTREKPEGAWEMTEDEIREMRERDSDGLAAGALYSVGDVVRATYRWARDYHLFFEVGEDGLQGQSFKELFPQLSDRDGRVLAQNGESVDAVVTFIAGRLGLCDMKVWMEHRREVEAMFRSEFAQQPVMRAVAMHCYKPGKEVTGVITDLYGNKIVMALPKGGLGFLKKSEMLVAPEEGELELGKEFTAVVVKGSKQGYTLCDKAKYALQRLHVGSPLREVYKIGDEVECTVMEICKEGALVALPRGGRGLLQRSHWSLGADGEERPLPAVGEDLDLVIFLVGKQYILLCDKEKWAEILERQKHKPQEYFKVGDLFTAKVVFTSRTGVYVQLPTAGKGFWPMYYMAGYEEGKPKPMPRRGQVITAVVQKITDKGVILCDKGVYETMEKAEGKDGESVEKKEGDEGGAQ